MRFRMKTHNFLMRFRLSSTLKRSKPLMKIVSKVEHSENAPFLVWIREKGGF